VVAISHGRDTGAVPHYFHPAAPIDCVFASAMGGSSRIDVPTNPNEISQALAERCGGRAQSLYAPAHVQSPSVRRGLLQHEAVTQTLQMAAGADMALVGIGGTDDGCTMVRSGCLTIEEMGRLRSEGAVGDVLGNYVDVHGEHIKSPHSRRLIGLSIDQLRQIETVVAVVSGDEKPLSILGVLHAGIVDVLIVDERNAKAVLDMASNGGT
jgi:DNA-binding transcriptional regulator LsrR (DeoR family)